MSDTTTNESAQQQAAPPSPPPLVRPREGRVFAGVAAGVADRLGIGTGWVRAGFVVATFFGGAGLVLYLIGWLTIPDEGDEQSIASAKVVDLNGMSRWLGVGLIAIGGLLVLGLTDVVRSELVWATGLVLAGVLLYRGELSFPPTRRDTAPEPPDTPPPSPPDPPPLPSPPDRPAPPPPLATPPPPPQPAPPKPRSVLGRLTLAAMLMVVGGMALFDSAGTIEPSAQHYIGAVVGVAGLGLVLGAWWGRARALIAVGLLLLPVAAVASVVDVPFSSDVGERIFTPHTLLDVRDEYRLGAGDLTIDLRHLEAWTGVVPLDASVGAGRLTVILPPDAAVRLVGRVGFGEIEVFSGARLQALDEAGISREISLPLPSGETSYVDAKLEVGFGQLRVLQPEADGSASFGLVPSSVFCGPSGPDPCSIVR